jgi:vacuolar-type H+-ATPase subunit F/Vma7
MMCPAVFIGDAVTAAGYRLAGVDARVPAPGAEAAELDAACAGAELVLVTAAVAERVSGERLGRLLAAPRPLLVLVGDARGQVPVPQIAARLRRQVGVGE